ncbi:unnamed protein product [Agarophyton chilense]
MTGKFGAYLRYTETTAPRAQVEGWLVKEGRKLRKPIPRFLRLQGTQLSNHKSPSEPPTWTLSVVDCGVGPGTRPKELVVRFPNRTMSFFSESAEDFEKWMIGLKRASASNITLDNFYDIGEVIGVGVNGDVLKGWDRVTNEVVAIKTIPYEGDMEKGNDPDAECEIEIIKSLDHPHLVKTYDVFRSKLEKKIYIVMEFVSGGELFSRIVNDAGNLIKEGDGIRISRNLLSAVKYLHDRDIVHRDIKTENVLCIDSDFQLPLRIKLADFGLSRNLTGKNACLSSLVGTGYYLAPEIIRNERYGKAVDMWACGVLLYVSLSGQVPFPGDTLDEYYEHVKNTAPEFPDELWGLFSGGAKDLICALLEKDPKKRFTVEQALQHPWVTDQRVPDAESLQTKNSIHEELDAPKSMFRRRKKRPEDILAKMRNDFERGSSSKSQMTS